MLWFNARTNVYVSERVLHFVRYYNASYVSFILLINLTISDKYINKSDCRFRKDTVFMTIFVNWNRSETKSNVQIKLFNNFSHNIKKVLFFLYIPTYYSN